MNIYSSEDYRYLVEGLRLRTRQLEERIDERMIETKIYFEEEDEKLAELHQDKRNIWTLQEKLIKEWRTVISSEMDQNNI